MAAKDSGTPGKGKHGVPDKQAHKVGKSWSGEKSERRPATHGKPGHTRDDT